MKVFLFFKSFKIQSYMYLLERETKREPAGVRRRWDKSSVVHSENAYKS